MTSLIRYERINKKYTNLSHKSKFSQTEESTTQPPKIISEGVTGTEKVKLTGNITY